MRNAVAAAVAMVAVVLACPQAHAQDARVETKREWYGWQILANDAAGLALTIGAIAVEDDSENAAGLMFAGTVAAWAVGGPAIDLAHGNRLKALESLGLRWLLPVAVGGVFYALGDKTTDPECEWFCVSEAQTLFVVGYLVGGISAQGADWFVLGYDEKPVVKVGSRSRLLPTVALTSDGALLGVGASF